MPPHMRTLIAFLQLAYLVRCTCLEGFEVVAKGECRGLYKTMSVSWYDIPNTTVATCNEIQSKPIIIHNDEECYAIKKTMRWEWADGSTVDYKPPEGFYSTRLNGDCNDVAGWLLKSSGEWTYNYPGSGAGELTEDIFCTQQLVQPTPSGECDGFADDNEDGVCYQIGVTPGNWRDAEMICKKFGANLASVHNLKENSFIRRLAVSKSQVNGLYLGALKSDTEYRWIDGSDWDYANFYPGFPIPGFGDCVVMDTQGANGEWVNVDCDTSVSVACMRPLDTYTTPVCPSDTPKEGEFIFSPGFPFDASISCDYMLMVESGKRVEVEIIMLEANSCCDKLLIFEDYFGGSIMAN